MRNMRILVSCIGLILAQFPAYAADPPVDLDSVLVGMKTFSDRFNEIPCWKVEFSQHRQFETLPPGYSDRHPDGDYVQAKKGKLFYLYRNLGNEHETWTAWKDGVSTNRVNRGDYHIIPEFHVNFLELTFFTQYVFLDIYKEHKFQTPSLADVLGAKTFSEAFWLRLPEGIENNRAEWALLSEKEEVNGVSCIVLQRLADGKKRDMLWVDFDHGFVCRKRQYFEETGQMLSEWINDDLREVLPELFLPFRQSITVYNGKNEPPEIARKKRYIYSNNVTAFSTDDIADDFFVAPMITEGQIVDMVEGESYIVRPGEDKPETRVSQALADAGIGKLSTNSRRRFLLFGNAILMLSILLGIQLRQIYRDFRHIRPSSESTS